ncbi:hypothetical protein TIFTF001_032209 [Ficus carica]|uniref:Uncharacterized protein n=1 Tax=Ficus carica TaxID=3494 RepID=A0AA88DWF8_FICCA|nr:hypothetical protein TIFTF001_032209 [Ficus carica]
MVWSGLVSLGADLFHFPNARPREPNETPCRELGADQAWAKNIRTPSWIGEINCTDHSEPSLHPNGNSGAHTTTLSPDILADKSTCDMHLCPPDAQVGGNVAFAQWTLSVRAPDTGLSAGTTQGIGHQGQSRHPNPQEHL